MYTRIKFCFALFLAFAASGATAQTPAPSGDSIRISEYLPVRRADPKEFITRFQSAIDKYAEQDRQLESRACDVLFLGSSSVNLWPDIAQDMAPMTIIRRSYGGSTIRDILYNYNAVARNYKPRSIVLYVENDISGSASNPPVGEVYDLFRVFAERIRRDHPQSTLYILSFKPSPRRHKLLDKQKMINRLLAEYAAATPGVEYVDIASSMYDAQGGLRRDFFTKDSLHMNRTGYDAWRDYLKPILQEGLK